MNRLVLVVLACAVLATACGSPDYWAFQSRTLGPPYGTTFVAVWISDSPVDGVEAVFVGIDRVELVVDDEIEVLSEQRQVFELLSLQHGNRAPLATDEIPARAYDTLRLVLAPESAGVHRVRTADGLHPLVLGAGDETIEIPLAVTFAEDGERELQVDFNARMSVLEAGDVWTLTPSLRLVLPEIAGAVRGRATGDGGLPLSGVTVSAQQLGVELLSGRTGLDGIFLLTPLPSGVYDVVLTVPGRVPRVLADRLVSPRQELVLGDVAMTPASPGTLSGRAPPGLGSAVRFRQAGVLIGVAGVDPLTGFFRAPSLPPGIYEVELLAGDGAVLAADPGVVLDPMASHFVDFTP